MMSMLYKAYALQEKCDKEEWDDLVERAALWVNEKIGGNTPPTESTEEVTDHFVDDFEKIFSWRDDWTVPPLGSDGKPIISLWKPKEKEGDENSDKTKEKKHTGKKIQKPVVTRWQYVGGTAECVLYSYLVIFRIAQLIIN